MITLYVVARVTNVHAISRQKGNSPNHKGNGQNVLYGDSHVGYESTPFAGEKQTHLYLPDLVAGNPLAPKTDRATTPGLQPTWQNDSIILPYR